MGEQKVSVSVQNCDSKQSCSRSLVLFLFNHLPPILNLQPSTSRYRTVLYWGIAVLCLLTASYLTKTSKYSELLKRPLNPLALNSSPYGMLLSSLLQQPVNEEWHKGIENPGGKGETDHDHDHDHEGHEQEKHVEHPHHQHAAGDACELCDAAAGRFSGRDDGSLLSGLSRKLEELNRTHSARTNPKEISPAHRLYIIQNIEKKLLLAYNLDPTNYAAYDVYYLFLTENPVSGLGSSANLKQARLITERTIALCNREQVNPLSAISGALATFNLFMMHFVLEKPKDKAFNQTVYIKVSEQLARYQHLKAVAVQAGNWDTVPMAWRMQADDRATFLQKVASNLAEKPADKVSN